MNAFAFYELKVMIDEEYLESITPSSSMVIISLKLTNWKIISVQTVHPVSHEDKRL